MIRSVEVMLGKYKLHLTLLLDQKDGGGAGNLTEHQHLSLSFSRHTQGGKLNEPAAVTFASLSVSQIQPLLSQPDSAGYFITGRRVSEILISGCYIQNITKTLLKLYSANGNKSMLEASKVERLLPEWWF